jgi:succinate dehydrogenase/fumarate reductase flavoprotein subunit
MRQLESIYDVIVVGAGGGGLRAAIGAAEAGAKTLVVCRGKANRSGATLLAGANISADIACDGATLSRLGISQGLRDDTPEKWFSEVVREGFYLNNQELVQLFTETAGARLEELVNWGMEVRGMEGDREVSVFGSDILDALYGKATALGVEFLPDTLFTDLALQNGQVCGVICVKLATGEIQMIRAKAVVVATGGAHNLFSANSGSTDLCGEGQAAAWRAGAELIDMEMISFCPTVTRYPTMYKGNILPYIFITTGYGSLLNKLGKTFTHRYLSPKVERLALESEWNKMLLSYAIQSEILAGRGARNGGVYFSLPNHPAEILEELYADLPPLKTGMYADIMKIFEAGRSLTIEPAAHYFEGGIRIWSDMHTTVPGLYAAGECAGGLFGANRVSAATTEMLIEGAQAGASAASFAAGSDLLTPDGAWLDQVESSLLRPFAAKDGPSPQALRKRLHEITGRSLTVIRCEAELSQALTDLEALEGALETVSFADSQRVYNQQWRQYLELRNMLPTARAITTSALLRRESRGVHIRSDYLMTDNDRCLSNTVLSGPQMQAVSVPAVLTRERPEAGAWRYTTYIEKIVETMEEGEPLE